LAKSPAPTDIEVMGVVVFFVILPVVLALIVLFVDRSTLGATKTPAGTSDDDAATTAALMMFTDNPPEHTHTPAVDHVSATHVDTSSPGDFSGGGGHGGDGGASGHW
jgi:uncharacterized membrane protein YgcG